MSGSVASQIAVSGMLENYIQPGTYGSKAETREICCMESCLKKGGRRKGSRKSLLSFGESSCHVVPVCDLPPFVHVLSSVV
jgi:hypothetical protein